MSPTPSLPFPLPQECQTELQNNQQRNEAWRVKRDRQQAGAAGKPELQPSVASHL